MDDATEDRTAAVIAQFDHDPSHLDELRRYTLLVIWLGQASVNDAGTMGKFSRFSGAPQGNLERQ